MLPAFVIKISVFCFAARKQATLVLSIKEASTIYYSL